MSSALVDTPDASAARANDRVSTGRSAPPSGVTLPNGYWIESVARPEDLDRYVRDWNDLASDAIEANVFYEPWMLLPALRQFLDRAQMEFVFVFRAAKKATDPPILCGFFPFQWRRLSYLRLPVLSLWTHEYCYLRTPLLRRGHASACLEAVVHWAGRERRRAKLIQFADVTGDGSFEHALIDSTNATALPWYVLMSHTRALLRRHGSGEQYLESSLGGHARREYKRQRRRLGDLGQLELRVLDNNGPVDWWTDQFVHLEARGWKGEKLTAIGLSGDEGFFRAAVRAAADRGQLQMLGLFLNQEPVAMKCNFLSGRGAFAFKIAFDERLARYSPGVLLELDNIEQFHESPGLEWMDSCAVPQHFMINRLWKERRAIKQVLLSTGALSGELVLGTLPLVRVLRRRLTRSLRPATALSPD